MSNDDRPPHDVPVRWAVVILALFFVLACIPVWMVKYPPMVDYPMHVARAFLLSLPQNGQGITEFYEAKLQAVPNLGMDLIVSSMMRFMPALLAGKVFVCAMLLVLLTGGFAFSVAIQKRITMAAFFPVLTLYDPWFFMGFANYLFGLGIALWAIAYFLWSENWPIPKRWAVLGTFFVLLLVCHLMALAVAVASCIALSVKDGPKIKAAVKVILVCAILCVIADIGLTLTGRTAILWSGHLETVLNTFGPTMFGVVGLVAVASGVHRVARAIPMMLGLLVFLIIGPSFLIGTAFASDRLSLPLQIALLATMVLIGNRTKGLAIASFCLLFPTVSIVRIHNWLAMSQWSEQVVNSLQSLPAGSTLATFDIGLRELPTWRFQRHVPDWILLDKPVFVAQNFSKPRQQPMVFQSRFEAWHQYQQNNPVELDTWDQVIAALPRMQKLHANTQVGTGRSTELHLLVFHPAEEPYTLKSNPDLVVETEGDEYTLLKVR